jgi:hypothetical protein
MDYLIFKTNHTTKDAMKNFKALDAYKFFVAGIVFPPRSKALPGDRVLLLGKVSVDNTPALADLCVPYSTCSAIIPSVTRCSH